MPDRRETRGNNQRRTNRPSADDRRAERTAQAAKHIAEMDARFARDIERSTSELRAIDGMPHPQVEGKVPEIEVVAQDCASVVLERGRGLASACNMAVLDFASYVNPGGGYDRGAWAQEEALCAESTLFNILRTQKAWYGQNRSRNLNCELYRNRALVVPKVRFERDDYHSYADIIVAAAPNAVRARRDCARFSTSVNFRVRRSKQLLRTWVPRP
jgi:uncharacterized protein (TIGR02452 family)